MAPSLTTLLLSGTIPTFLTNTSKYLHLTTYTQNFRMRITIRGIFFGTYRCSSLKPEFLEKHNKNYINFSLFIKFSILPEKRAILFPIAMNEELGAWQTATMYLQYKMYDSRSVVVEILWRIRYWRWQMLPLKYHRDFCTLVLILFPQLNISCLLILAVNNPYLYYVTN